MLPKAGARQHSAAELRELRERRKRQRLAGGKKDGWGDGSEGEGGEREMECV